MSSQYYAAALEQRGPSDSYLRLKLIDSLHALAKPPAEVQNHIAQAIRYRPNVYSLMPILLRHCLHYIGQDAPDFGTECRNAYQRFDGTGGSFDSFVAQNRDHPNFHLLMD